MSELYTMNKVY